MASPDAVTIVVPAFNEGDSIGQLVTELRATAPWHEVLCRRRLDRRHRQGGAGRRRAGSCAIPTTRAMRLGENRDPRRHQRLDSIIDAAASTRLRRATPDRTGLGEYDL